MLKQLSPDGVDLPNNDLMEGKKYSQKQTGEVLGINQSKISAL